MGIHTPQSLPPTPVISGTQGRGGHTEILIGMGETERKGEKESPREWGEEEEEERDRQRPNDSKRGQAWCVSLHCSPRQCS